MWWSIKITTSYFSEMVAMFCGLPRFVSRMKRILFFEGNFRGMNSPAKTEYAE